ncbi:MAG: hypothetical protein ABIK37_05155 [candidate division WOR-3 bacterium]
MTTAAWTTLSLDTVTHTRARKWTTLQAIAADDTGYLHACWVEGIGSTPKRVLYSRRPPGGAWNVAETVGTGSDTRAALAVETRTGRAHIAWAAILGDTTDLCYSTNSAGPWQTFRITSDTVPDFAPSIALENDSVPHIAWITREPGVAYRIGYATNRTGVWTASRLSQSQLGQFGSGAQPFLAISPSGRAHAGYRGGDYGDYHIHHAENSAPGDTHWVYEILTTGNLNDFTAALAAKAQEELALVCSGNDYWGAPFRTYYLHRPAGSSVWDPAELMTASASATLEGFCVDGNNVHATWQVVNGNVLAEQIWHVSDSAGYWFNSPVRADSHTSRGALAVDRNHCGHALVVIETPADTELYCINSAPLTGIEDERQSLTRPSPLIARVPVRFRLDIAATDVIVYSSDGRIQTRLRPRNGVVHWNGLGPDGRSAPSGLYLFRTESLSIPVIVVR